MVVPVQKINTLSLFAGGGGLDLGFSAAGYNVFCSSDIDSYSCKTLESNQGKRCYFPVHKVICDDVTNLTANKIIELAGGEAVDFIIGGPPCQAFSVFGRRKGLEDPRGNLVFQYARLVKELKPQGFLFENVFGLKTIHGGQLYTELMDVLSFDGEYTISAHEYEVAAFGVPQFRKRLFFIGHRNGGNIPLMSPTHVADGNQLFNGYHLYKTVSQALSNLPEPTTDWGIEPAMNSHVGREHGTDIIKRYASLKFGERDSKTRINKLNPDKPSYTIVVGSDKGGGKGHVHPFLPREVTPRESARIQTFPDWWEFSGTGRHVIRQVGNAVPPLFAAQIAAHVASHIFGICNEIDSNDFIDKLELSFLKEDDH